MKYDQLINKQFHILQRNKILKDKYQFIFNEINTRIIQSINDINLQINECLEIGIHNKKLYEYIDKKFPNSTYLASDISSKLLNEFFINQSKICFDNDKWPFQKNLFNLIVSNCYIHLSNNFNQLLQNIYSSLKSNGFFIASIPGKNTLYELKNSMILTDLECYGGAYNRFLDFYSIDYINETLQKNKYKSLVIDIDTIQLRYKTFSNLLEDIRYLGHSNINVGRKSFFEIKNYFKKVEEIYWKKFSNNNQLIANIEIIYISAWKNSN